MKQNIVGPQAKANIKWTSLSLFIEQLSLDIRDKFVTLQSNSVIIMIVIVVTNYRIIVKKLR
jgi:hypothetical protein